MADDDSLPEDQAETDGSAEQRTGDAADPKANERRKVTARAQAREAKEFWSRTLRDPIGAREIWNLLQSAHFQEERFACGPTGFPQPEATWFHAGEQSVAQRLYQMLCRMDRAAVFAMHDQFDPAFAEVKSQRKKRGVTDGR